jgi:hypothetical protein
MTTEELVKKNAENAAYTCKGLFKTADFLKNTLFFGTLIPLIIGLISLSFNSLGEYSKVLGICSIVISFVLVMYRESFRKINDYYELANDYRILFNKLEEVHYTKNFSNWADIISEISELNKKTSNLPILWIGRKLASEKTVKHEMGIDWF